MDNKKDKDHIDTSGGGIEALCVTCLIAKCLIDVKVYFIKGNRVEDQPEEPEKNIGVYVITDTALLL
jgi:hypothetical protein